MKILSLAIVGALGIFLAGCTQQPTQNSEAPTASPASEMPSGTTTGTPAAAGTSEQAEMDMYTLAEISQHSTKEDCWFAVEGKVYNVTEFIASGKHPGKEAILQGCGKDATELFNEKPGTGRPHSDQARMGLDNFQIGILAQE